MIDTADLVAHRYGISRERQANIYKHLPCIALFTPTPPIDQANLYMNAPLECVSLFTRTQSIKELTSQATFCMSMIDTGEPVARRYANRYEHLPRIALCTRTSSIKELQSHSTLCMSMIDTADLVAHRCGISPRTPGKYI